MVNFNKENQIIKILTTLRDVGSISRTAEQLYLTQPTVSKLIRQEEDKYHVQLIDRKQHPLKLTAAGEFYLESIQNLNHSYQLMANQLSLFHPYLSQTITIGVNPAVAVSILPKILPTLKNTYPEVKIRIMESPSIAVEQRLLDQEIDVYLGMKPSYHDFLSYQSIYTGGGILLIKKDQIEGAIPKQPVNDLSPYLNNQELVIETNDSGFQHVVDSYLTQFNISPKIILETANIETAKNLALAGYGATIIPENMLPEFVNQDIAVIYINPDVFKVDFTIAYQSHSKNIEIINQFIDTAQQVFPNRRSNMQHLEIYGLGTDINLSISSSNATDELKSAQELIKNYEDLLTVNRAKSEVMSINQAAGNHPVQVSEITYNLIERATQVSLQNKGFNIAIGPIVKLWSIGFDNANVPDDDQIQQRLALTDPQNIKLDKVNRTVYLTKAGMEIDLGAIAKGYIADAIKALWTSHNIDQGIIDLGGNLLFIGPGDHNGYWNVGIQDPDQIRDKPMMIIQTSPKSVVTSGIYERFLKKAGKIYHHILDSQTGYPMQNDIKSASIISDKSIDGEIWSTISFYEGIQQGIADLEKQPEIEGILVTKDNQIYVTSGIIDSILWVHPDYQLNNKKGLD